MVCLTGTQPIRRKAIRKNADLFRVNIRINNKMTDKINITGNTRPKNESCHISAGLM
jgi:hypothetical protein